MRAAVEVFGDSIRVCMVLPLGAVYAYWYWCVGVDIGRMCTTHMQHTVTHDGCMLLFLVPMPRTPTPRNGQCPRPCCPSIFTLYSALALALVSSCVLHLAYHTLTVVNMHIHGEGKMLRIQPMDTPATMTGLCFSPTVFHCGLRPLMLRWGGHLRYNVLVRWPLAMYAQVRSAAGT